MNNDIAIKVESLTKIYHIYDKPQDRFKEALHPFRKPYHQDFYAVNDVSFEIKKGETVGIIGRNGAGKSTLLKMITGVLTPTSGRLNVDGKIASLLELGAGFNPEMTGIENIYLSGMLMGFSHEEMSSKLDDILAFADIGDFINQVVKSYSSGMFVRLAFAVNIVSNPEIMIVDEALSVGDMSFQAKCMTALTRMQQNGATVLFVSHDIGSVKSLCSRAIYLENGAVKEIGAASDIAGLYVRAMRDEMAAEVRQYSRVSSGFDANKTKPTNSTQSENKENRVFKRVETFDKRVAAFRYGSGGARVSYIELLNSDEQAIQYVEFNQKVKVRIYFEVDEDVNLTVNFQILDAKKNSITAAGYKRVKGELFSAEKGGLYVHTYALNLPLKDGSYSIQTHITIPAGMGEGGDYKDVIPDAVVFEVGREVTSQIWSSVYLFPELTVESGVE